LTWEGQLLVAVDISSSQPTLLVGVFDSGFWIGEKEFSIHSLPYSSTFSSPSYALPPLIKMCNFINAGMPRDVRTYIDLIQAGGFKDGFRELVAQKTGVIYPGDAIKPLIFQVLYTSNRFIGLADAAPKRAFKEVFPTVYDLTVLLKKGHPEFLPTLLQRMESYLMFHKILPRIAYERPNMPIFSIHDSLVVTEGNEAYVEQVMFEEIQKAIGINPHFKMERWTPDRLVVPS